MRLSLVACLLVLIAACSVYDPELLRMRDGGAAGSSGTGGTGGDDNDAGDPECRAVPDSNCDLVCIERCNGMDDDCDGTIDNNGAASSCGIPNAEATCDDGVCRLLRCQGEYADCNGNPDDGCEVLLPASPDNCGLCGAACVFPNGAANCALGQCLLGECDEGFADCDGQPSNGCETNVRTLERCGACLGVCEAQPNARPTCDTGVCAIVECVGNFGNCDGMVGNGCETPLNDPDNCGECGVTCSNLPNATATCGETGCEGLICSGDYQNCDGRASNGCEALLDQPDNCGMCGMVCDLPNVATHLCEVTGDIGTCLIDDDAENGGCDPGFADCNGNDADGCERPLNTTTDCGACNSACAIPNAVATCETGSCAIADCAPGSADCDPSNDDDGIMCQSLESDPLNCGTCGTVCSVGAPVCSGGRCRVGECPMGTADCDDNDTDCETDLTQAATCGSCTNNCAGRPNTTAGTCGAGGVCQLTCAAGFANCNGNVADGCETNLRTNSNCGACGTTCAIANATATCATGSCRVDTCASTHRDCDMNATSCEINITLPTSCGSCTNDCTGRPNTTSAGCSGSTCELTCAAGYRNCNGTVGDGCEVNINTPANCGSCGNNCAALANVATATCTPGGCNITACNSGFADCDGLPGNGCERSITTLTDCGGCNMACSFPNAAATCSNAGVCSIGACNGGFGNCNNVASDGCEAPLNTTTNCNACGTTCSSGQVCNNGTCGQVNCPSGFSLCGGTTCIDIRGSCPPWPGCINTKPNKNHCGQCNFRCPLYGGDHCCI